MTWRFHFPLRNYDFKLAFTHDHNPTRGNKKGNKIDMYLFKKLLALFY